MKSTFNVFNNLYIRLMTTVVSFLLMIIPLMGQTSGPAGIGNSTGDNGQPRLTMWLDASELSMESGEKVSVFTDRSGNGNHAEQPSVNNQPVFQTSGPDINMPAVVFNAGQQHFMTFNGNMIAGTDYTFTFIGGRNSDNAMRVFAGGSHSGSNNNLHIYFNGSNNFNHHHFGNDFNAPMVGSGHNGGTARGTTGIFTVLLDQQASGNFRKIYQNNDHRGSYNHNNGKSPLLSWNGAAFARYSNNNSSFTYHDVFFSEVIVYANALNNAQLTILNNYLHYKYGIAIKDLLYTPINGNYISGITGIGVAADGSRQNANTGSGGGILLDITGENIGGEGNRFVFAAHNNAVASETTEGLPALTGEGNLLARSSRNWFLQRTSTSPIAVTVGFDLQEAGIQPDEDNQLFMLLFRENEEELFSVVENTGSYASNGKVSFRLDNASVKTGIYTLAKSDQTGKTWYSYRNGNWDDYRTWTLEQGGADYNNPLQLTPFTSPSASIDKVVINSGHTVTITQNNKQNHSLTIENGVLNMGTTQGHRFESVLGKAEGTLRMAADNFPAGDATQFTSNGGGNIEINGDGWAIRNMAKANNLRVNLVSENAVVTLLTDLHISGNLNIEQGTLRINDDENTRSLSIYAEGNVHLRRKGKLTVGRGNTAQGFSIPGTIPARGRFHSIFHQVTIGGDLLNEGTIRFTNQTAPHYRQFTSTGAATLTFTGAKNATATLNGTTDLYNLIINKGNDQSFVLEIESAHTDHFRLFGPNSVGRDENTPFSGANPEVRKALWIRNGTLKLNGNIYIPSLTEGSQVNGNGDYPIPANGALWIAGPGVSVFTTAHTDITDYMPGTEGIENNTGNKALSVMGNFKITAGFLSTRNSAGFIFWPQSFATVEIAGGICDVAQLRSATNNDGKTNFIMTGGEIIVRGNLNNFSHNGTNMVTGGGEPSGSYPIFGITDPEASFIMSGGTISIYKTTGNNDYNSNALYINTTKANHNVTGGTIRFIANNENITFDIFTSNNLYNLELVQQPSNSTRTTQVHMGTDLTLEGNLSIGRNTVLNARRQHGNFRSPGYDLTVARNFTISTGGAYNALGNTTTLYITGTQNTFFYVPEVNFYNLVFEPHPVTAASLRNINNTGQNTIINVFNNLTIAQGSVIRKQNQLIRVRGNVYNSGEIRHQATSNTGRVVISDRGTVQTITLNAPGSHTSIPAITVSQPQTQGGITAVVVPVFEGVPSASNPIPMSSILIVNPGSGYTSAPEITISAGGATAKATLSTQHIIGGNGNGIFAGLEINEPTPASGLHKTVVLAANQRVSGTMTLTQGIVDLENFNLQIDGKLATHNTPDELTWYSESRMFRLAGRYGDGGLTLHIPENGNYLFPIGTFNTESNTNRYAYMYSTFSNVQQPGKVQVNAVPSKLPTLSDGSGPNDRRYLKYYWRVRHTFAPAAIPFAHNRFYSHADDYYSANGNINFTQMVVGKVIENVRFPLSGQSDEDLGVLSSLPANRYLLDFKKPGTLLEAGEFTSGRRQLFNGTITVYYNRTNAGGGPKAWNQSATWSTLNHTSTENTGTFPGPGDVVILSNSGNNNNNHYVRITENVEVAKISFKYTGTGWGPRLLLNPGVRANISLVGGIGGQIGFEFNNAQGMSRLHGDLSEFNEYHNENQVIFFPLSNNNAPVFLPDNITEFPSVRIHGAGGNTHQRMVVFPKDVVINGSLRIDVSSTLRLYNNMLVKGNVMIGPDSRGGRLEFPASGSPVAMTILGNLNVGGSADHQGQDSEIRVMNDTLSSLVHTLQVEGDITLSRNGRINLFSNNANGNNVALRITGDRSTTLSKSENIGTQQASLYSLEISKGNTDQVSFTLNEKVTLGAPSDGENKALTLKSGTLVLNHHEIDIALSTGGSDFAIPANTGLVIDRGTARITAAGSNGIYLDGNLEINGPDNQQSGQLILDGGPGSDNYIFYSSSGRAQISVTGGNVVVGSQIRGSLSNDSGILKYHQLSRSGYATSRVLVGKNSAPSNERGVFDIHNPGSRFRFFSGTLTIARGHDVPSDRAAVRINPSSHGLNEWGAVVLGDGINPSIITFATPVEMPSVTVKKHTQALAHTFHFATMGNLLVEDSAAFNASGLNLTVRKNFTNRGNSNLNSDTLFLPSIAAQQLEGKFHVKHLVVTPSISSTLRNNTQLVINGNLSITQGLFMDGGNAIHLTGNLVNNGIHTSSGNGRIVFGGNKNQYVSGSGRFGKLELNTTGQVHLSSDLLLENNLIMENGILNLGFHRLTMAQGTNIQGTGFSSEKMIATSGSIADKGLRIPVGAGTSNLLLPVGVITGTSIKYTPATLQITSVSGNGFVGINPVNQPHMTATGDHVLQYYWIMESQGVSNINGEMQLHYHDEDLSGDEGNYYTARLMNDAWQKLPVGVNPEANYAEFYFGGADSFRGDYTAGTDNHIPAQIPIFVSRGNGHWTDIENWTASNGADVPAGGPNGHIVIIREGDQVNLDRFRVLAYRTEVHGNLNTGTEAGHNLGRVSGSGTITIPDGKLPAGIYTDFFAAGNNSTIEYTGEEGYIIPNLSSHGLSSNTYNNLVISGSGAKIFPASDITIRGDLTLTSGSILTSRAVQKIMVAGNVDKNPGAQFNVDYLGQTLVMNGNSQQSISGNFTGADNALRNLEIRNNNQVLLSNNVSITESFILAQGTLNTGNHTITVNRTNNNAVTAQPGSFVKGNLARNLNHTVTNAFFPIGDKGVRRDARLSEFNNGVWIMQYFHENPALTGMASEELDGLESISNTEYWSLSGPSGSQSKVQLSWGLESNLPNVEPVQLEKFIAVAQWEHDAWRNMGNAASSAYGNGTGFVRSANAAFFFTKSDNAQFFTLGSTNAEQLPLPIELISFTGKKESAHILLQWVTAAEINNDFFTLERSSDGINFQIIGYVPSSAVNGHSNTLLYYDLVDENPVAGTNYYRLKQTDFDGSFEYSDIIAVEWSNAENTLFSLFPNPNTGNSFRVALSGLQPYEILDMNVTDFMGKSVYSSRVRSDDNGSVQAYVIPQGRFNAGVYVVTLSGSNNSHTARMVVNK